MNQNKTEINPAQAGISGKPNDPSAATSRKNAAHTPYKEPASGELAAAPCSGFSEASDKQASPSKYSPNWFWDRFCADGQLLQESNPILKYLGGPAIGTNHRQYRFIVEGDKGPITIWVSKEYLKALHYLVGESLKGDVFVKPPPNLGN